MPMIRRRSSRSRRSRRNPSLSKPPMWGEMSRAQRKAWNRAAARDRSSGSSSGKTLSMSQLSRMDGNKVYAISKDRSYSAHTRSMAEDVLDGT